MENRQNVDAAGFDAIRNDIRRAGDDEFARTVDPTRPAGRREPGYELNRFAQPGFDASGRLRIALSDVAAYGRELPNCGPRPPNPHGDGGGSGQRPPRLPV